MSRKRQARHPTTKAVARSKTGPFLNTGYNHGGASLSRQELVGWTPTKSSPKSDIDVNLGVLRNRSGDMVINSPLGAAAIGTNRAHVVGSGLKLSPKIDYRELGLTPEQAVEWQRKVKAEFALWADGVDCDLYRKNNFYDMQDIAFQSMLVDGDSWAAIKYRPTKNDNPYCLKIQLVEASRICNPNSITVTGFVSPATIQAKNPVNGNRIINGVEIDSDGAVVAYWVANRVPYDPTDYEPVKWIRVQAFGSLTGFANMLQISHEERAEQYRGVPYLAPVLSELKQIERFTNAELTAAIIKSYFTLFFTTKDASEGMASALPEAYTEEERGPNLSDYQFVLGRGTMNELPPGYDVKTVDGSRNLSTFEPFVNALISQTGAALGIPSEVLLSRFQSSYSAARGALLQFMAVAKTRRTWFARDFCQPVYEMWLAEAVAIGRIEAKGFFDDPIKRKAWSKADWYGPVMGQLDPVKEAQAAKMREEFGYSTGEREAAEMGSEYEDNIVQLGIERQRWKNNGLSYPVSAVKNIQEEGGERNA